MILAQISYWINHINCMCKYKYKIDIYISYQLHDDAKWRFSKSFILAKNFFFLIMCCSLIYLYQFGLTDFNFI